MANEHFGWPSFYEDPDVYFEGVEAEKKADARRMQESLRRQREALQSKRLAHELTWLAQSGIERVKELSYRKIVFPEARLGIGEETAQERIQALREAARMDEERNKRWT